MQLKRKASISFISDIFLSKVIASFFNLHLRVIWCQPWKFILFKFDRKFPWAASEFSPWVASCNVLLFIFSFAVDSEVNNSLIALIYLHVIYGMRWCRFTFCVTWINFTAMTILLLWIISSVTLITGNLYTLLFFSVSYKFMIIIIFLLKAFIACMWLL